tara:strand:+ start:1402 stop:1839 length:438 start_codon:yes stop_codon:yes gene_type:complete
MDMNATTPYAVSITAGCILTAWMVATGVEPLKSLGAGLMIGSALFMFVGFFSKPKYEFGKSTILFNAMLVDNKLKELDDQAHHKQIYGKRIREGIENIPSRARLNSMLKPELVQICIGLGLPSDPDLYTKKQLIESIITSQEEQQ